MGDQSWKELVEELDDGDEKPVVYTFGQHGRSFRDPEESGGVYDGNNA